MEQTLAHECHLCIALHHETELEIYVGYFISFSFKNFITDTENHVIMFLAQLACKQLQGDQQ